MQRAYRHIFFDLDETLWDFDTNSRNVLYHLVNRYGFRQKGIDPPLFVERYHAHNQRYWVWYREGSIDLDTLRLGRWRQTLDDFGLDVGLAPTLSEEYLDLLPQQTRLVAHAQDVVRHFNRFYQLHILTNGFSTVQNRKLEVSGLHGYFRHVITAEQAGYRKPDPGIFHYAFALTGATVTDSILIGDSAEADVQGARAVGMACIHLCRQPPAAVNPEVTVISCLRELYDLL